MKITATYKGLITAVLMIIVSIFLFYGLKHPVNAPSHFIIWAIYVAGLVWSLFSLKISAGENHGIKAYFSEGFKTFIVVTLLIVIYTVVFYKLNPQILEAVLKENDILAAKEGNYTPADIANNSNKLRSIFMPMTIAVTTITHLVLGAIVSLIGGAILSQPIKS